MAMKNLSTYHGQNSHPHGKGAASLLMDSWLPKPPSELYWKYDGLEWPICTAKLADIGYYCNALDVLCVSRNALCSLSPQSTRMFRQCICEEDHIPVYEKHLGYHECYRKLNPTEQSCHICSKAGGTCYIMDTDKPTSIGCSCLTFAPFNSTTGGRHISRDAKQNPSQLKCSRQLDVSCTQDDITICYTLSPLMDWQFTVRPPYMQKIIVSPRSGFRAWSQECVVKFSNNDIQGIEVPQTFCRKINVSMETNNPPCGIHILRNQTTTIYQGSVLLFKHKEGKTNDHVQELTWSCSAGNKAVNFEPHLPQIRQNSEWYTYSHLQSSGPAPAVNFAITNADGHPVSEVRWGSLIRMVCNFTNVYEDFKFFGVEECSVVLASKLRNRIPLRIVHKGCPSLDSSFAATFTNAKPVAGPHSWHEWEPRNAHIESTLFPAFLLYVTQNGTTILQNAPLKLNQTEQHEDASDGHLPFGLNSDNRTSKQHGRTTDRYQPAETIRQPLEFSCVYRICRSITQCIWTNHCNTRNTEPTIQFHGYQADKRLSDFMIMVKSAELTVVKYKPRVEQRPDQSATMFSFHKELEEIALIFWQGFPGKPNARCLADWTFASKATGKKFHIRPYP
ncbi:hypothetical protein CRM22_010584 [Opisthorchis felineus]|uniref:Uncharacterized protein n=1 Tax=Opisthorchis felineus TaxID=147828 RepID=A0A4S2KXD9_OPIFE|nr:hypothetical protein CRM22_010584 [Opisthorchis felineus]